MYPDPDCRIYRVGQVVVHLGLVDFDFYIPSSCPAPQPILPHFQLPKQNEAGSGMSEINVNPTHVHLNNPVDEAISQYSGGWSACPSPNLESLLLLRLDLDDLLLDHPLQQLPLGLLLVRARPRLAPRPRLRPATALAAAATLPPPSPPSSAVMLDRKSFAT